MKLKIRLKRIFISLKGSKEKLLFMKLMKDLIVVLIVLVLINDLKLVLLQHQDIVFLKILGLLIISMNYQSNGINKRKDKKIKGKKKK